MVDLDILRAKGVSSEAWEKIFNSDKVTNQAADDFRKLAWGRANDGVQSGLSNWTIYKAIDAAWDTPLRQTTPTLLTNLSGELIANQDPKAENVLKVFQSLKLEKYLVEEIDSKTQKPTGRKTLDIPTFFSIIIPLVKPYVTIRWSKLCNDRRLDPFLKYEPLHNTVTQRVQCDVITSRVQLMSEQFNYPEVMKQSILGMLLYPEVYQFIRDEWFCEKQLAFEDETEKEIIVREGLTYHRPHPTRAYKDEAYPGYSLLTDTGCRWAGYWRIMRFGELEQNKKLWNRNRIRFSSVDWSSKYAAYFSAFYSCVMQFPSIQTGDNDRETTMAANIYTSDHRDMGTMVVEHFEKFKPKDVGLGDYDYDIWARILFAGDGTILYATPLPGVPCIYYGDCVDGQRDHNASLALELLPFQDCLSNLLTQAILSAKQNLSGITPVDTNIVSEKDIKELENVGEAFYRTRKYLRYDSRKLGRQQLDATKSIFSVALPYIDVNSIINCFHVVLNLLERVVQISPQEVGSAASHEQSRGEIEWMRTNTGNRLSFTSASLDRSTDAWKRQLYEYLMAYGDEEIYAHVSTEDFGVITEEQLSSLGFTVVEKATPWSKKVLVKGKKSAIQLEYFASAREGDQRTSDNQIANAMTQVFVGALQNPMLAQAIGPEQGIDLLNSIIRWLGLPKDFRLKAINAAQNPALMQEVMGEVQKAMQASSQQVLMQVQKGLEPLIDATKKAISDSSKAMVIGQENSNKLDQLNQMLGQVSANPPPQPTPPDGYDQPNYLPMGPEQGPANPQMALPVGGPVVPFGNPS